METRARARAEADLPKVSQPARAGLQLGLHAGSPRPSAPHGSCGPRLGPAPGAVSSSRNVRAHNPGSQPPFGRLHARAATQGAAKPWPRGPPPPSPPVAGCTAGSHTPCRGRGLSWPCRRRTAATASGVRYARPQAAGITSGGR